MQLSSLLDSPIWEPHGRPILLRTGAVTSPHAAHVLPSGTVAGDAQATGTGRGFAELEGQAM